MFGVCGTVLDLAWQKENIQVPVQRGAFDSRKRRSRRSRCLMGSKTAFDGLDKIVRDSQEARNCQKKLARKPVGRHENRTGRSLHHTLLGPSSLPRIIAGINEVCLRLPERVPASQAGRCLHRCSADRSSEVGEDLHQSAPEQALHEFEYPYVPLSQVPNVQV